MTDDTNTPDQGEAAPFDPSAPGVKVQDVLDYLGGANPDEYARVVDLERTGQARVGILSVVDAGEAQTSDTVEPDDDGYTRVVISS